MSVTEEPPARRAVKLSWSTRRILLLAGIAAVAAVLCIPLFQRLREPMYEGRRVSAWFGDLCMGVFPGHDASRWSAASAEFSRMDSNAVPFLVKQLTYDQGGTIERMELGARKVLILSQFTKQLVIPSMQRTYAAVALKQMGTNAVSALQPMQVAIQHEPQRDVRVNTVMAMAVIVGFPAPRSFSDQQWQEFERAVLERARRGQF